MYARKYQLVLGAEKSDIFPTRTIVHPCIDVVALKYVQDITRSICSINQEKQSLQRNPVYLTDYDHYYIL